MNRLLIGLTVVLASGVIAAQAWAASTRFVALRDNFITLSSSSAPHGSVTFTVTNRGNRTHNFRLQRVSTGSILFSSRNMPPGDRVNATRTLATGRYRIFCSIHSGMSTTFRAT